LSNHGVLYIVAAPSGGGKTSLVKNLLASTGDVVVSVSHTTRPKRPGDQDGVDYFFISEEEFSCMVQAQAFIEHADVFGYHYGTSKQWVMDKLRSGTDIILEIDWQGSRQIRQLFAEAISIFILPPSVEVLRQRLVDRNQDSREVIAHRMQLAQSEMRHYYEFDYLIINDDFAVAAESLRSIVISNRLKTAFQAHVHEKLLAELVGNS